MSSKLLLTLHLSAFKLQGLEAMKAEVSTQTFLPFIVKLIFFMVCPECSATTTNQPLGTRSIKDCRRYLEYSYIPVASDGEVEQLGLHTCRDNLSLPLPVIFGFHTKCIVETLEGGGMIFLWK